MILGIGIPCVVGCQNIGTQPKRTAPILGDKEPMSQVTPSQVADVQIAMGRVAEKRGDVDQAMAAYQEALKRDGNRADAYLRLASLKVQQGKYQEAEGLYRQALQVDRGNPDAYSDMGYSLYLQRRWAEAEMNLRQAITLRPEHQRAHNNLGLVLAHNARSKEALAQFREAGCSLAEAHSNLAFALTMDRKWPEAREQYRLALAAEPSSQPVEARLKELDTLIAKVDPRARKGIQDPRLIPTSATVAPKKVTEKRPGPKASDIGPPRKPAQKASDIGPPRKPAQTPPGSS
jgi:tetratricopeptide (TPR) repeat protein